MEEFFIISEAEELTKAKVRKMVRDEIEKALKKVEVSTKKDVKDVVKDMMIKQYKFFWEKRSFWTNNI
jgi:chemotaxis methyl-accepting protein methylase